MLHPSKSQSILQWFNALTTNFDVRSLSQFADGSLFCDIVTSVYSQAEIENPIPTFTLADCSVHEESAAETSSVEKGASTVVKEESDNDGNASTSTEQTDVVQKHEEPSSSKTDENATKEYSHLIEIRKKYDVIEKFIDAFYQIKSNNLIAYPDCMEGKDMELAKVAVLLLSAMVQNLLSSYNEALHTIHLLDVGVQEDIKELLSLLLEREDRDGPLTKAELHKVLGHASKYKGATPRRKTPHRGNPEPVDAPKSGKKRRGERVTSLIYEDNQESPLNGLLKSPNNSQHRIAIALFKKETELSKLRNSVHAEEMKVVDLMLEKRNINEELTKKKDECDHLKLELRKQREASDEGEVHASMERANFLKEMERLNISICQFKDELKSLEIENARLTGTVYDLENQLKSKKVQQESSDRELVANAMKQMNEMQQENNSKELELRESKKKMETLEIDIETYKQMYEELKNKQKSPVVTPNRNTEVVSNIYNADAMEKLHEKEQEIEKAKKLYVNLKNQLKEKTDNMKAVLDKLSSLQEKYENLLNKTKGCATCGTGPEPEEVSNDGSSSSQFGRLWDATPRGEKAPHTRSRSSSGARNTVPVNLATIEKLKTLFRLFAKMVIRWKIVDDQDQDPLQQVDAQTRNKMATVDDFVKSFERILCVLKKFVPTDAFAADMKALKEQVQEDRPEQDVQTFQEKFRKMKEQFQQLLKAKESELKAAKNEIKKLITLNVEADQKIFQLESKANHLEKISCNLKKENIKLALAKDTLLNNIVPTLKARLQAKKEGPCDHCSILQKKLVDASNDKEAATRREEELIMFRKEMEAKLKSYERQVQNLMQERKELKLQIQHTKANSQGNHTERTRLIRKYLQLGKEEDRRKAEEEENKKKSKEIIEENLQPVVNVNTYIVHPEKRNPHNETSMSNHFGNCTINSAYLQTEDEEDFLNHSSLAQIQNSVYQSPPEDNRLRELQRRNTFCPPHLQSSYPLELHRMTPSERKYSMAPPSIVEAGTTTYRNVMPAKKRKVSEMDTTQPLSKRMVIGSSGITMKPRTPVRQAPGKAKVFKTPQSIRRLIGMQGRKNKMQ